MPRVSAQHRENRKQQILQAARNCFVRNGFHATSVDDIILESQLSAGAVYRYFPGKDAIVFGVVDAILSDLVARAQTLSSGSSPSSPDECVGTLLKAMQSLLSQPGHEQTQRIAILAWGEAQRNEVLRERIARFYAEIGETTDRVISSWIKGGAMPNTPENRSLGRFILGTLPSLYVHHLILGEAAVGTFLQVLGSLVRSSMASAPNKRRKAN